MAVSPEIRAVEREIDALIEASTCWKAPRALFYRTVLDYYRDVIEMIYLGLGWAEETDHPEVFQNAIALETHLNLGILQIFKWVETFTPTVGGNPSALPSPDDLRALVQQGHYYTNFVDALKMANHDLHQIRLDRNNRLIIVYEGGDKTGFDKAIVDHQHSTNPFHLHSNFTNDTDQLTRNWTAGDYRHAAEQLCQAAISAEKETVVSTLHGEAHALFKRPVIFEVPPPSGAQQANVFMDISFPSPSLAGKSVWNWSSWMDSPLLLIDGRRYAVSSFLKAGLSLGREMHMLRLAARVDPDQYSKVSQLREDRMIQYCCSILQDLGWTPMARYLFKSPSAEIDVLATKGGLTLLLELKSTLRPESPWETYKRNDEIIKGIEQVFTLVRRVGRPAVGVVLTDGYRGDYQTWSYSIKANVPTGSINDLPAIAEDPKPSFQLLSSRSGFDLTRPTTSIEDRSFQLAGWTVRLTDSTALD